jgi:transposase
MVRLFQQLALVVEQIGLFKRRMRDTLSEPRDIKLPMTLPGIGLILATVILSELGDIRRFPSAA